MVTNNAWNTPDLTLNGEILVGRTGNRPIAGNLTSTGQTLVVANGAGTINVETQVVLQTDTGWGTWGGAGNYFDDTTLGSFTISRPGTGFINGVPVSWTAPQTVAGMTAGNTYFIYIDNTGTIGKTATRTDALFQNNIVLFECLRDSTAPTNNQVTVKENHPYNYPVNVSNYEHDNLGTLIENNDNGANIVLNGTQKIQINGADVLSDHGLKTTIPDSAGAGVTWIRMFTLVTGKWARQNATDTFTGYYNNGGAATALGAGKFGIYTLYVCKDTLSVTTPTYFAVLHTAQFNNIGAARAVIAAGTNAKATQELMALELCQLGTIIYGQAAAAIVEVTISKTTLRSTISTGGTSVASAVTTDVSTFTHGLTSSDTNVQVALTTLSNQQFVWVPVAISGAMTVNTGYITTAGTVSMSLPTVSAVGTTVALVSTSSQWIITQAAGQSIEFDGFTTTVGVGGSVESGSGSHNAQYIKLLCTTANTTWYCLDITGNPMVI